MMTETGERTYGDLSEEEKREMLDNIPEERRKMIDREAEENCRVIHFARQANRTAMRCLKHLFDRLELSQFWSIDVGQSMIDYKTEVIDGLISNVEKYSHEYVQLLVLQSLLLKATMDELLRNNGEWEGMTEELTKFKEELLAFKEEHPEA